MRLEKVKICNFRSFSQEQTIVLDELTTIIGNNSSGKTAALTALRQPGMANVICAKNDNL